MRYRRFRITRPQVFAILMVLSVVMVIKPFPVLTPFRNMIQLGAYVPQMAAQQASQLVAQKIKDHRVEPLSMEDQQKIVQQKESLEVENIALHQQIADLQSELSRAERIRKQPDFPRAASLIPAKVIGSDAAPGRDSLTLGKGSSRNIKEKEWVCVQAGTDNGVRNRLPVLAHEYLIGWVTQVAPWTSRVVLLTDPLANRAMPVQIFQADGNAIAAQFSLQGAGKHRMRILDIPRDQVENKQVRVGNRVTSDPGNPDLPVAMVIGEIIELKGNKAKPIYYDAIVKPMYDSAALNQVFIVDLNGGSP